MDRRTVLQTIVAGSAGTIGGCLDTKNTGSDRRTTDVTRSDSADCPSFSTNTDEPILANGTPTAPHPVTLQPTAPQFTVDTTDRTVETFGLTLHNRSDRAFVVSPGAWTIVCRTDDGWSERAAGDRSGQPITVAPSATHTWSLSLTLHPSPLTDETTFVTADLAEGTYVFAIAGRLTGDRTRRIEPHARFELLKAEATPTTNE